MKKLYLPFWFVLSLIGSSVVPAATENTSPYRYLAEYYAPVIYQDVDTEGKGNHADGGRADYITHFNFDGNWIANDNWENASNYSLPAYVYYSVVESNLRYYITYAFYHPRDYKNALELESEHENDMEGIWLSVYKDGSAYGSLEAMVTAAHSDFYQYSNYAVGEREDIDGPIGFEMEHHPRVYSDARSHAVYADKNWYNGFPGGDGVVYQYTGTAQEPVSPTQHRTFATACPYDLIHIDQLWQRRPGGPLYAGNDSMYASFGTFKGDAKAGDGSNLNANSANAPWGWDDHDDNDIYRGEHFFNPAHYFDYTLSLEKISGHAAPLVSNETYVYNPYCITVDMDAYYINWDQDGSNDLSDGYFNLYMPVSSGEFIEVLDGDSGSQKSWIGWDLTQYTWHDLHALLGNWYHFYGVKYPGAAYFGIRSRDWDSGSGDEWLMSQQTTHFYPTGSYEDGMHFLNMSAGSTRQETLNWDGSQAKLTLTIPAEPAYTR